MEAWLRAGGTMACKDLNLVPVWPLLSIIGADTTVWY